MSGYPAPDRITDEFDVVVDCWWTDEDGTECREPAVTTRYERSGQTWQPVCDKHRR